MEMDMQIHKAVVEVEVADEVVDYYCCAYVNMLLTAICCSFGSNSTHMTHIHRTMYECLFVCFIIDTLHQRNDS